MSDMMTFPDTWEEYEKSYGFTDNEEVYTNGARLIPSYRVKQWLDHLPSAQTDVADRNVGDLISRQDAIDAIHCDIAVTGRQNAELVAATIGAFADRIKALPSVQPEKRTCVNCGRTVNNGGWYADGRTRCPIEEHYALPKDGFCHLWEERNVTDDDYPERREK